MPFPSKFVTGTDAYRSNRYKYQSEYYAGLTMSSFVFTVLLLIGAVGSLFIKGDPLVAAVSLVAAGVSFKTFSEVRNKTRLYAAGAIAWGTFYGSLDEKHSLHLVGGRVEKIPID